MVSELFLRTIVIDDGVVVFDGSTEKLLANQSFLERHGLEAP
jgi:hypothetical protein